MALAKYDSSLAYDQIMQRGLPGRVVEVTDPDTGIPVEGLLAMDGQPIARLVSNSQGYVQPFMVEDGPPLVRVRIETVAYHLLDLSLLGEASLAAQQAAQAAIDAANLVGAPADTAIATAVNAAGSATQSALNAKYASKATATSAAAGLMAAADKAKLDAATSAPTASRVMARDANGRAQVAAPAAAADIAPKSYVDTTATTAANLVQLLPNPGGGDLNTFTSTGRYRQPANAAALAGTNYPAPFAGLLTVSTDNPNMVFQTYQTYGASSANRLYWRANYNGTWQPWQEAADTATTVRKGELFVNVRDYGAKGDGTTDDTAAVQAAMNAVKANGGGRLFFPYGDYYIRDLVWLCSNVEIYGDRATIRKKFSTDPSYVVFAGSSGSTTGYGAGANNVYIHDLTFRGKFGTGGRGLCVLALNHSDDVLAERLNIAEASGGGHRFDLGGCRRVMIRDCVFQGFDTSLGSTYNEDIQADYSTRRSGSFLEPDVNCYDGLPSQDVVVENNHWLPWTTGGVTYPAANPFGTHGTVQNVYITNIAFLNNTVLHPISDDGTVVPGTLHFLAVKNLRVEGNKIIGANSSVSPAIACYQSTGGQDPAEVKTTAPSISYTTPMRCENVSIRNNEITGFHNAPTIIQVKGSSAARCFDVEISGNLIYNTNATGGTTNVGPITVDIDYVQRFKYTGNIVRQSRRLVNVLNSLDVTIQGNVSQTIPTNIITLGGCSRVAVVGNNLIDIPSFGIYAYNTTGLTVNGNTFSCNGAGPAVRVGDAGQFSVVGNTLTGFSATKGIEVTGTSTGVVLGNSVSGFTTPLTPATTTGGVQVGWNAA